MREHIRTVGYGLFRCKYHAGWIIFADGLHTAPAQSMKEIANQSIALLYSRHSITQTRSWTQEPNHPSRSRGVQTKYPKFYLLQLTDTSNLEAESTKFDIDVLAIFLISI